MEKIHVLINELEAARAELTRLIDEAVKDHEFLNAHFHNEALMLVNRQLQTLKNLDDKSFDRKNMLNTMLENAEQQLQADQRPAIKDFYKREIEKRKQELEALEQKGKVSSVESSILAKHLDSLVSREIRELRIVLMRSSNFVLHIRTKPQGLKLTIPRFKSLRKHLIIHNENLQHLIGLGFAPSASGDKLELLASKKNSHNVQAEVQIIISKIVFEVFYYKEFAGESFIEIE